MLNEKFKDRNPNDTIKIINNFFKKRNCLINIENEFHSDANTYSYSLKLLFNGEIIATSSGKGETKEYALASGYAEMYERFCGYNILCQNFLNLNEIQQQNYKTNHYYIDKDEKKIEFSDVFNDEFSENSLTYKLPKVTKDYYDIYSKAYSEAGFIGAKYKALSENKEDKYICGNLVTLTFGSNGLAAGNTLEEALVQGTSELFERYCLSLFYSTPQSAYYKISQNSLPANIKLMCKNIEKNTGCEVRIYDLSYNFKVPVCMAIIIDKKNHTFYRDFGSHPKFEIAAERCITEIYQGVNTINTPKSMRLLPSDYTQNTNILQFIAGSFYSEEAIPEELFLNTIEVLNYNKKIFSIDITDNKDLLKHNIAIGEKANIYFYYRDISLCKNFYAVHILTNKILISQAKDFNLQRHNNMKAYNKIFTNTLFIMNKIRALINNNNSIELKEVNNFINIILKDTRNLELTEKIEYFYPYMDIMQTDFLNPYTIKYSMGVGNMIYFFRNLIQDFYTLDMNRTLPFLTKVEPLNLYLLYKIKNKYTDEQIKQILSALGFDKELFNIDINNPAAYIKTVYIDWVIKEYNSEKYKNFINLFIKKQEDF